MPVVEWNDYHDYISPILDRHDAITGVFWIPRVNKDALARLEQIAEESGPPGFNLQYGSDDISASETGPWLSISFSAEGESRPSDLFIALNLDPDRER